MILNNSNIQISILEIKRNRITLLNKLPYLFDSRQLKGRHLYEVTDLLKIEYGQKPPVSLDTTKYICIKSSTTPVDGLMAPLANSSPTSFWITGWFNCISLMLKHLKSQDKRGWPLTIFSTNLLAVMLLHWSKNWGSVPTCPSNEEHVYEVVGCNTPMTLLPRFSRTTRCMTRYLPAILNILNSSFQVRHFFQKPITRIWHKAFLNIKLAPSFGSDFATTQSG